MHQCDRKIYRKKCKNRKYTLKKKQIQQPEQPEQLNYNYHCYFRSFFLIPRLTHHGFKLSAKSVHVLLNGLPARSSVGLFVVDPIDPNALVPSA